MQQAVRLGLGKFLKSFFQRLCELIGAGGVFHAATDTGEPFDEFGGRLVFGKTCNSLEISVATALDNEVMHVQLIIEIKCHEARAYAGGDVGERFHGWWGRV